MNGMWFETSELLGLLPFIIHMFSISNVHKEHVRLEVSIAVKNHHRVFWVLHYVKMVQIT